MSFKSKNVSKKEAHVIYRMLKCIDDVFQEHKVTYWIAFGTLLGAVRHSGLIPHDDDGDICIMQSEVRKLPALVPVFLKLGYVLSSYKDDPDDEDFQECKLKSNTCSWYLNKLHGNIKLGTDIFIMKTKGDRITYADPGWEQDSSGGKRCYFLKNHVFPLMPITFGNFQLMAPRLPVYCLNLCYGVDWNHQAQMLYNHRTGEWSKSTKHTMSPDDFQTIAPPKDTKSS